MTFSISQPLKVHLAYMKDAFCLSYQDMILVTRQMYHYFISPNQYYKQYAEDIFDPIGLDFNNPKDACMIKIYELGMMACSCYFFSEVKNQKTSIHDQLETMSIKDVIKTFYSDSHFALNMIHEFLNIEAFPQTILDQTQEKLKQNGKSKVLEKLYPPYLIDVSIHGYQKIK